jgi:hypothetical protein
VEGLSTLWPLIEHISQQLSSICASRLIMCTYSSMCYPGSNVLIVTSRPSAFWEIRVKFAGSARICNTTDMTLCGSSVAYCW